MGSVVKLTKAHVTCCKCVFVHNPCFSMITRLSTFQRSEDGLKNSLLTRVFVCLLFLDQSELGRSEACATAIGHPGED